MEKSKNKMFSFVESLSFFIVLLLFVLLVNFPVISFDMMYPEQATLYLANQQITNLKELLHIYLQPKMLNFLIPFFRPSGHFLIYQILTPLLGWHNTKGLIIVNFIFLALTGTVLVKLYRLLFPGFVMGGYIAFSIYLMHPALSLSRFVVMHFEFAHTFFLLLSLYCFVLFCQSLQRLRWLLASVLLYAFSVTFKETAFMLGPVLIVYFFFSLYQCSLLNIFSAFKNNKDIREIFLLLFVVTFTLGLYLSLQCSTLCHPMQGQFKLSQFLGATNLFFSQLTGINYNLFANGFVPAPDVAWRNIVFPFFVRIILWCLFILMFISTFNIFAQKSPHRKSVFFLTISIFIFLVMPFLWAMGLPWHLSLALLFITLLMGFSVEYALQVIKNKYWINNSGLAITIFFGCLAIPMNQANIDIYKTKQPHIFLDFLINRNAVLSPPEIKSKLNRDSFIVVEDRFVHDTHMLGNSFYPFYYFSHFNYRRFEETKDQFFLVWNLDFSGALFRWAYLMPSLREQTYRFKIEKMDKVASIAIYNWLQQYNNIFCLSYDENANWHDNTTLFKKNLLIEKNKRHLIVNHYTSLSNIFFKGKIAYYKNLLYPDVKLCQYLCDQDKHCKGFLYLNTTISNRRKIQCHFYKMLISHDGQFNPYYTGYIKTHSQEI